jgi:hypothetical protein
MENTLSKPSIATSSEGSFSTKNILIISLILLLVFSFLGINILNMSGNIVQNLSNTFGPVFAQLFGVFGYTAGSVIDTTTDIMVDTAKTGVDIAGGTLHSVGDILKSASQGNVNLDTKYQLDQAINDSSIVNNNPNDDGSENPIQNSISSNKIQWCLVGEYQGRRGCVSVDDTAKCLSGQIFPSQQTCLNPTMSDNMNYYNQLKSVSE